MWTAAWAAAALAAVLAGCTPQQGVVESAPPPVPVQAPPPAPVAPGATPPAVSQPVAPPAAVLSSYPRRIEDLHTLPAVLALYRQAQAARAGGHPDQAKAALDRALHIEPRNPFIWQGLAGVQMDLHDPDQAEQAARKSTSLAHGNPFLESGNWRLIASARQALGDAGGALDAQARADGIDRMIGAQPAQ
ncbi:MAG: tetratricopeptide repeat protein [Nevskia sp.]|nr:tetratricopeptide repeat protein [Nevskia sp.]